MRSGAATRPDRRKSWAPFRGRARVNTLEYEYLRKLLKDRSGLVLSSDKQYLLESRLLPIVRRLDLGSLAGLVAKLRAPGAEPLVAQVVEAMTTNESLFFRDKI